jgi:Flp pilus assembly pilin Flp
MLWRRLSTDFLRDEEGQNLVEYAILLCWMTLASVAVINGVMRSEEGVWRVTNSQLTSANTAAS